jgi:hypothetical protein
MKIASVIARYLLGLVFPVFGLNGFLTSSTNRRRQTRLRYSSSSPPVRRILSRSSSPRS